MKQVNMYMSLVFLVLISFPLISFSQYEDSQLGHDGFMGEVKLAKLTTYKVEIKDGKESFNGLYY